MKRDQWAGCVIHNGYKNRNRVLLAIVIGLLIFFTPFCVFSDPVQKLNVKQLPKWVAKLPDGLPKNFQSYGNSNENNSHEGNSLLFVSELLDSKANGFVSSNQMPSDEELKNVYLLEAAIVDTIHQIANSPDFSLSVFDRSRLVYDLSQSYITVRTHAHRMSAWIQEELDRKLPGGTGLRYPVKYENSEECGFLLNCRTDKSVTSDQRKKFYEEKRKKFLASGGDLGEMFRLDLASVSKLSTLERLEYVQREDGDIWVSSGKAGHVLLAEGQPVKAAGQLLLVKSSGGQSVFVVASSGSGSYRPYRFSVDRFRSALSKAIGYPEAEILVTDEEPLAPLLLKLAHKARGTDPKVVDQIVSEIEKKRLKFVNFLKKNPNFKSSKKTMGEGCVKTLSQLNG